MKMFNLFKLFLLVFSITSSGAIEGHGKYWNDYTNAKRSGTVRNQIEYLEFLSEKREGDTGPMLLEKKNAILWFVTTGGRNGFSNRSATTEERSAMEKALMFSALVNETNDPDHFIDIISMKPKNSGDKIEKHLRKAQEIIFSTRVLIRSSLPEGELKNHILKIFHGEVKKGSVSPAAFSKVFTPQNNNRVRDILEQKSYFGFTDFILSAWHNFAGLVLESIDPAPMVIAPTRKPFFRKVAIKPFFRKMVIETKTGLYPDSQKPIFAIKGDDLIIHATGIDTDNRSFLILEPGPFLMNISSLIGKPIETDQDLLDGIKQRFGIVEWMYLDQGPHPFNPDILKELGIMNEWC